ncbi:MAG: TetR/AcrR family transcriptional regulator [Anaerolineales bacterium]|nr:TetR/AcrR family transcriptional regulator [Anaerolineales bacterium]
MARTVKEHEHTAKRNEILNAAQLLIFSKGYERMTIKDILAHLKISSGAFYHYFDSKQAVLEGFIERIQEETEKPLLPILNDPHLSAIEKLLGFFGTLDSLRTAHKAKVIQLLRVWYTDENAIVRQKVDEAVREQRAPLLEEIVRQGVQEGVFSTPYPAQAGEVILSLLQGMGNTHAKLLLSLDQEVVTKNYEQRCIEEITSTYAAYMSAIERVLGSPPNSLQRPDAVEAVKMWVTAQQASPPD